MNVSPQQITRQNHNANFGNKAFADVAKFEYLGTTPTN